MNELYVKVMPIICFTFGVPLISERLIVSRACCDWPRQTRVKMVGNMGELYDMKSNLFSFDLRLRYAVRSDHEQFKALIYRPNHKTLLRVILKWHDRVLWETMYQDHTGSIMQIGRLFQWFIELLCELQLGLEPECCCISFQEVARASLIFFDTFDNTARVAISNQRFDIFDALVDSPLYRESSKSQSRGSIALSRSRMVSLFVLSDLARVK